VISPHSRQKGCQELAEAPTMDEATDRQGGIAQVKRRRLIRVQLDGRALVRSHAADGFRKGVWTWS